jgi:hypothetical protein
MSDSATHRHLSSDVIHLGVFAMRAVLCVLDDCENADVLDAEIGDCLVCWSELVLALAALAASDVVDRRFGGDREAAISWVQDRIADALDTRR